MPQPVRDIPLLDLISFLIETPDSPTHVGVLQLFAPVHGSREAAIARILEGFRAAEVAPPFSYVPLFPPLARPKWALADAIDPEYHVRHVAVPAPGTQAQLIEQVMDLHAGIMDRSRPGWIAYVVDGLEQGRFALYLKIHHAYIDGASATMRLERAVAREARDLEIRPLWSNLMEEPEAPPASDPAELPALLAESLRRGTRVSFDLAGIVGRTLLQASGRLRRALPLPFSAPRSLFNGPVHATRRLGVGQLPLARFRAVAKQAGVSINDVALALVGDALERYAEQRHEAPPRPLVAICPMSIRAAGDTSASTQIAAISVLLGTPGSDILARLAEVHASASAAKTEARAVSRDGLVAWLALLGGTADLLGKSPLAAWLPPATNVNVSNVAGPDFPCYLGGAEMLASYPVSTLAGGTAINITFASACARMDYAAITDASAVPDPERITAFIAEALERLEHALAAGGSATAREARRAPAKRATAKRATARPAASNKSVPRSAGAKRRGAAKRGAPRRG
jgi:diacylglycerol O-acyltransferase